MPVKNAVSKRSDAERAAEWYTIENQECVVTRRAIRAKFNKVDFFGSDVVGKREDGSHVYVQVTAGQNQAVTERRRKLERVPWHETDTVILLQLRQTEDPANARRKKWFFRVMKYRVSETLILENEFKKVSRKLLAVKTRMSANQRIWANEEEAVEVPRSWFKAYPKD